MKIGLDFDGVIVDCGQLKSDGAMKFYGVNIPPARFRKRLVLAAKLLTLDQYNDLQRIIYDTPDNGLVLRPVRDIFKYLSRLKVEGHSIVVITSRRDGGVEMAREWAAKQRLGLEIISVGYGNSKAEAAKGLDVFVDDDIDKLRDLVGIVPHLFLFLWDYNLHDDAGNIAVRIASWEELYRAIQGFRLSTREI